MTTKQIGVLPASAIPMSKSFRQFVPELWSTYEQAVRTRSDISKRKAAPRIRGTGAETCRVSREQKWDAEDHEEASYSAMMKAFVARLIAGELIAIAQRDPPFGEWQPIAAEAWRRLRIEIVRYGLVVGLNTKLLDVHIVEGDRLPPPVRIKPREIGRPTSLKLVVENFCRRAEAGEAHAGLRPEARHQSEWLEDIHAAEPQMEFKSVEKNISELFHAWKAGENVGELCKAWNRTPDFCKAYRGWLKKHAEARRGNGKLPRRIKAR